MEKKYERYLDLTTRALAKVKIAEPKEIAWKESAEDMLMMAKTYYEDAKHFKEKGDLITAIAALSYAHAWLDAGARLGLFDVGGDNELFVVD